MNKGVVVVVFLCILAVTLVPALLWWFGVIKIESHEDVCADGKPCPCPEYYYKPDIFKTSCEPISNLKVTHVSFTRVNRKNFTVIWQQDHDFVGIAGYEVSWIPGSGSTEVLRTARSSQVTGLDPGTEYLVAVTTLLDANNRLARVGTAATVKTKQDLLKPCTHTSECGQQYFAECSDGGFCRCVSGRYRNADGNCHNVDELRPSSFAVSDVFSWSARMTWNRSRYVTQVPDVTVTYAVTAGGKTNSTSESSILVNGLTAGLSYSADLVTTVKQDGKNETILCDEHPSFTTPKIRYNMTCRTGDICLNENASCIAMVTKRCLCNDEYFWATASRECKPVTYVKPGNISIITTSSTSLRITWTVREDYRHDVSRFEIIWSPGDAGSSSFHSHQTADVTGLIPGKQYSVLVRAFTVQEGKEQFVDSASVSQRTFPDIPGPYSADKSERIAPNITLYFEKSQGILDYYNVSLTARFGSYHKLLIIQPSGQFWETADFTNTTVGEHYILRIIAASSGVPSDPYVYKYVIALRPGMYDRHNWYSTVASLVEGIIFVFVVVVVIRLVLYCKRKKQNSDERNSNLTVQTVEGCVTHTDTENPVMYPEQDERPSEDETDSYQTDVEDDVLKSEIDNNENESRERHLVTYI